jgi:hypothetical protein
VILYPLLRRLCLHVVGRSLDGVVAALTTAPAWARVLGTGAGFGVRGGRFGVLTSV